MDLRVYSTSRSLQNHLNRVIEPPFDYQPHLGNSRLKLAKVSLVHISSVELPSLDWLDRVIKNTDKVVGICSDNPDVLEMLECVEAGARAYCNSYMQAANYQQMLRLLSNGQSWFPPSMLSQAFSLAHRELKGKDTNALLQGNFRQTGFRLLGLFPRRPQNLVGCIQSKLGQGRQGKQNNRRQNHN